MQNFNNISEKQTGNIFNIQKYSVHDGPGIRTLVFLKGCPLRCQWCSNPESQADMEEIAFNDSRCIGAFECGLCLKVCSRGAIQKKDGAIKINRELCTNCGACSKTCPSKALHIFGKQMSIEETLKKVKEDNVFYSRSGGGLTLSGGEPLLQHEFVYQLITKAKLKGLDTAIETCGFTQWEHLKNVCQYLNTIFYDLKSLDSDKHLIFTGVKNELILENFKRLATEFSKIDIIVRTPVIPGFNDTEDDIKAIAGIIKNYPGVKYELLPYHGFGGQKYTFLGREYPFKSVSKIPEYKMNRLISVAKKEGIVVVNQIQG